MFSGPELALAKFSDMVRNRAPCARMPDADINIEVLRSEGIKILLKTLQLSARTTAKRDPEQRHMLTI